MGTKKFIIAGVVLLILCCIIFVIGNITEDKEVSAETEQPTQLDKPLNISIFLDLSDRLTRQMTPSQMSRDTAIIGYIVDYFKTKTLGPKILSSKNNIKVFFYPAPQNTNIATLANDLSIDMEEFKGVEKRVALEGMKNKFQTNLEQIYDKTIQASNWIGCDIWDFFSSKKVDTQCMRKDARNIIFILTDGYLFDANHKIQNGNAYSYILPQTLNVDDSSLIVKRDGLDELEVCILEVNPYDIKHRDKMVSILENWLQGMGVRKEHIIVAETDIPTNTQTIIKSFLE